jgi:phosphoribosylformylglycinamidine synthase PurS subunit
MKINVVVKPKEAVLDPQVAAVSDAKQHQFMPDVRAVRIGKFMEIEVDGKGADVEKRLHRLCRDLLSNPVIEDYELQKSEVRGQRSEIRAEQANAQLRKLSRARRPTSNVQRSMQKTAERREKQ